MEPTKNDDLKWLLELLEAEGLAEIEVTDGEDSLLVRAASAPTTVVAGVPVAAPAVCRPAPATEVEVGEKLLAPMGGIFYRASSPETPPYAEIGDEVRTGDTVGLIEAMKLYNEVASHVNGRIIKFLVENEQAVEADQPLVLIERTTQ